MDKIDNINTPYHFISNDGVGLLIFLPSTTRRNISPYYPRISWQTHIRNVDILYLADPFRGSDWCRNNGGSWFIDENGDTCLPDLARSIKEFTDGRYKYPTILYGSSMGGYATLALHAQLNNSVAIAECPQIYLNKYQDSASVIENTQSDIETSNNSLVRLYSSSDSPINLSLVVNNFDSHKSQHVDPFVKGLTEKFKTDNEKDHSITVITYAD